MSARIVFGYAVLLLVTIGVSFMTAAGDAERHVLVVPGICALVVAGVAAMAVAQTRWPNAALLAGRLAATLPLIVAAALAMRAIRVGAVVTEQVKVEAAWAEDVEQGRAAEGPTGRDVYFRLRGVPPEPLSGIARLLWGLVGVSVLVFLVLQYDRFRGARTG